MELATGVQKEEQEEEEKEEGTKEKEEKKKYKGRCLALPSALGLRRQVPRKEYEQMSNVRGLTRG